MNVDLNDNPNEFTLRQKLSDELKSKGAINTSYVEAAFRAVPHHLFVLDVPLQEVYTDQYIITKRIDNQVVSSSSQPSIMATMLEQLDLEPGHKVLEIGTGTGYNAALMAHIVGEKGQVVTVDIDEDIADRARQHLAATGFNQVQVVCVDGGYGYSNGAPYDRIILTAMASDISPAWREQLKPNGRLVLPLEIERKYELSIAFEPTTDCLVSRSAKRCGFMPLRGAFTATPISQSIQIGSDPSLSLSVGKVPLPDAERVYEWLTGSHKDWETGVEITGEEIGQGLRLWLMLHEPGLLQGLVAQDKVVEQNLVPPLFKSQGDPKWVSTQVLCGEEGMVALMYPPDQLELQPDANDPSTFDIPFRLFIRQLGTDEYLAYRLLRHIKSWDEAGRPLSEQVRLRAYPKDTDYEIAGNEFVIKKERTRFVLDWSNSI